MEKITIILPFVQREYPEQELQNCVIFRPAELLNESRKFCKDQLQPAITRTAAEFEAL